MAKSGPSSMSLSVASTARRARTRPRRSPPTVAASLLSCIAAAVSASASASACPAARRPSLPAATRPAAAGSVAALATPPSAIRPRPNHLRGIGARGTFESRFFALAADDSTATDGGVGDRSGSSTFRSPDSVTILSSSPTHLVVSKPPSVPCHHSEFVGSRRRRRRAGASEDGGGTEDEEEEEVPMIQRVRNAVGGRRVNLVHRLDRGASGCLLMTFADNEGSAEEGGSGDVDPATDASGSGATVTREKGPTAQLIDALTSPDAVKTYVALVRGEGILSGEDLRTRGWFDVTRPIKDEKGRLKMSSTSFRFIAGQSNGGREDPDPTKPRASLVLARPSTGRWHQVRRHLNGLSHPILGDSTHGSSATNREWKSKWDLSGERICLHLSRIQLPPTEATPGGIDVVCPLEDDMRSMLETHLPSVLREAEPILKEEGIVLRVEDIFGGPNTGVEGDGFQLLPFRHRKSEALGEGRVAVDGAVPPVEVIDEGSCHIVVAKPPCVVCHHSRWTDSQEDDVDGGGSSEIGVPMLQRVRDRVGAKVNLVHRLDRGASGCLLLARADTEGATSDLAGALTGPLSVKTYIALVRGDGVLRGEALAERGWFTVSDPVKADSGKAVNGVVTDVRFVASGTVSCSRDGGGSPHVSLVLARPRTGKWHQVRQHLAGGSVLHPILGDSSHGYSKTNREWRERGLLPRRLCLHLARMVLPSTGSAPEGVDVACPLSDDIVGLLEEHLPELLRKASPILEEEGVVLQSHYHVDV